MNEDTQLVRDWIKALADADGDELTELARELAEQGYAEGLR